MGSYNDFALLHGQFTCQLGRAYRGELPESLIRELAVFCDRRPTDGMTAFYASRLLDRFYRKRSTEKSRRLLDSFETALEYKPLLIIVARYWARGTEMKALEALGSERIWRAIEAFDDGYDKANLFAQFGHLLTASTQTGAFNNALAMARPYKARALSGIFPSVGASLKASIFAYLLDEFRSGEVEAAWGLRRIFPYLGAAFQEQLVTACLQDPKVPDSWIAYFVIRNCQYLSAADKASFVAVIKSFRSEYLKIRCLLVLADQLPHDELAAMVQQFMASFHAQPPDSARMHNFYQISRFLGMSSDAVVMTALNKIARLKRHFARSRNFCELRGVPICY